uniref:ribosomal protein S9 n=1 Tax=Euglena deses TaxID=66845 RepID=UPI0023AB40AF|nr:ribosomal protein S9 [Euglena deses]WCH63388.1 ribosomal protein S9 [Euglena deses]
MSIKTVGRRKCSVALTNIVKGTGLIQVNGKDLGLYVQNNPNYFVFFKSPLLCVGLEKNFDLVITSKGGGLNGQSEARKLSISRALYQLVDENSQKILKTEGFLTRNSLCKERRS